MIELLKCLLNRTHAGVVGRGAGRDVHAEGGLRAPEDRPRAAEGSGGSEQRRAEQQQQDDAVARAQPQPAVRSPLSPGMQINRHVELCVHFSI